MGRSHIPRFDRVGLHGQMICPRCAAVVWDAAGRLDHWRGHQDQDEEREAVWAALEELWEVFNGDLQEDTEAETAGEGQGGPDERPGLREICAESARAGGTAGQQAPRWQTTREVAAELRAIFRLHPAGQPGVLARRRARRGQLEAAPQRAQLEHGGGAGQLEPPAAVGELPGVTDPTGELAQSAEREAAWGRIDQLWHGISEEDTG